MLRAMSLFRLSAVVAIALTVVNAFQTAPRIRAVGLGASKAKARKLALYLTEPNKADSAFVETLNKDEAKGVDDDETNDVQKATELEEAEDERKTTELIVLASNVMEEPVASFDLSQNGWVGGVVWRGVVAVLCALWASNFAAAKLIMDEPGVDSSLYAVTRFSVAALSLAPFAVSAIRRTGIDAETAKGAAVCGSWVAFGKFAPY